MRLYGVQFEIFDGAHGWVTNALQINVAVRGGAEQAIRVATQRMREEYGNKRLRAEEVRLIGEEG